jgi:hypothetical protein
MTLTALAILCFGTLALAGAGDRAWRGRLVGIGVAWLVAIVALAGLGLFSRTGQFGIIALGAVVLAPIIVGGIALARSRRVRLFATGIRWRSGGRSRRAVGGGFFLALHQAGRLPPTFALTAGYGDLFIGLTALPLTWAIHRRVNGWQRLALAWNALGALDLVTALSLGIGSAAGSPLRFIFETPDSGAVGVLPWALIPGLLVPLYMLTHVAISPASRPTPAGRRG